jgi:hypothetical protein
LYPVSTYGTELGLRTEHFCIFFHLFLRGLMAALAVGRRADSADLLSAYLLKKQSHLNLPEGVTPQWISCRLLGETVRL